jgi:hypothetical protein
MRMRNACLAPIAALALATALASPAAADCVTGLSYCAQRCDLRVKPESHERPACANTCVTNFQQCLRAEAIREGTTGPLNTPKLLTLPPGNN